MAREFTVNNQQANTQQPLLSSSLKIIFQNVNGWETNKILHKQFFLKYNPDIIIINDTGISQEQIIKFYPYKCYHSNSEKEHSGAAIFIKQNISHTRIDPKKFHHDTVAVSVETKTGPIIIATNYHPQEETITSMKILTGLVTTTYPVICLLTLTLTITAFPTTQGRMKEARFYLKIT